MVFLTIENSKNGTHNPIWGSYLAFFRIIEIDLGWR